MSVQSRLFLRIVSKSPDVYLLKVVTLSIAFACSTLIILFAVNEFGYDRFHYDHASIFRVLERNNSETYSGNRLSNRIPSAVVSELNLKNDWVLARTKVMEELTVITDGKPFYDQKIHASESAIIEIFSFELVNGSFDHFNSAQTILLSASAAGSYFGTKDAAGKKLRIASLGDTLTFTVAAVYKDFPQNSHESFNAFINFQNETVNSLSFNPDDTGLYGRYLKKIERDSPAISRGDLTYRLQPLSEIYFGPRVLGEDARHGDSYSILILIFIASLILFFALTSFVNLTTLTLPNRSKELAVKKLAGTSQLSLVGTFTKESFSIVGISLAMGLVLLVVTAPWMEPILSLNLASLLLKGNVWVILILVGLFFVMGIAPVFMTLKFAKATPTRLLSTDTITFPRFKRTIIFLQLGISIFLIVASVVIRRQINYSLLKEPGRNYDQVVHLQFPYGMSAEGLASQRAAWKKYNPNIVDVMATSQLPGQVHSKEVNSDFYFMSVDPGFKDFFDLKVKDGRWFHANDDSALLVNPKGMSLLKTRHAKLIGVYEDLSGNYNNPEKPIKINLAPSFHYNYLCVRILEVDIRETVAYLKRQFGTKVSFLDHRFEEWINYQDRLNKLSGILAIISGFLSCCAVYGLSISMVRDKLKQIAIHKLFGANTGNITRLLVREFARQALLAILVFGPITYIVLTELLRGFVYATKFNWMDPMFPLIYCATIITLLCGFQAVNLNRSDLTSSLKG